MSHRANPPGPFRRIRLVAFVIVVLSVVLWAYGDLLIYQGDVQLGFWLRSTAGGWFGIALAAVGLFWMLDTGLVYLKD